MKNLIFLILLIPFSALSQNSFEYIYQGEGTSGAAYSFLDHQGYYITLGTERDTAAMTFNPLIIKFQDTSDIQIVKIDKPDGNYGLSFGFQKADDDYIFVGYSFGNITSLYVVQMNEDMELINENMYEVPEEYNSLRIVDVLFEDNEDMVVHGILDDPAPGMENDFFLAKISAEGQLLDSTILAPSSWSDNSGSELLKKPDGSGYILIGPFTIYFQLEFDNNLNLIGKMYLPVWTIFPPPLGIRQLSDGNMIIESEANQDVPNAYYDMRIRIVDQDFQILKDTTFLEEGKNRVPEFSGLDYEEEDNIWAVSHSSVGVSGFNIERGHVFVLDSEMNNKGSKYFGGNTPKYLFTVNALSDGGCIITGMTPQIDDPDNFNIYLRKLMLGDIITNAEETPAKDDSDVSLFPNPVVDVLHIETYRKDLSLRLFDESGRSVIEQQVIHIPNTQINTSQLPCGVYIYSVYDKEKLIETGKIIKK